MGIAVSQAREAMGIEGNQWYRPVLYLRWQDNEGGQLFNLSTILSYAATPQTSTDNSAKNQLTSNDSQKSSSTKLSRQQIRLQEELTDLLEEREACNNQYRFAIDDAQRIRLKRKLDDFDNKISDIERQINNM